MCINSMESILIFVKIKMANLMLGDDFVIFVSFFHFFPKWKGRKYFFRNGRNPVFTVVITVNGRNLPTLPLMNCQEMDLVESFSRSFFKGQRSNLAIFALRGHFLKNCSVTFFLFHHVLSTAMY